MSNQEILERAIRKAIENGWKARTPTSYVAGDPAEEVVRYFTDKYDAVPYEWLIFNHDFAKALWGSDVETDWLDWDERSKLGLVEDQRPPRYLWQWHLQRMVIADDPIAYLGEHI